MARRPVPTTQCAPAVAGGRALFVPYPWWFAGGLMAFGLGALPRTTAALAWRPSLDLGARFDNLRSPVAAPRDTLAGTIAPRLVTWAQVEFGAAKVLFGGTTSAHGPALVLELGGPANPLGMVTTSVALCEQLPTAVSAGIGRPLPSGTISIRWESLLDAQGRTLRSTSRRISGAGGTRRCGLARLPAAM